MSSAAGRLCSGRGGTAAAEGTAAAAPTDCRRSANGQGSGAAAVEWRGGPARHKVAPEKRPTPTSSADAPRLCLGRLPWPPLVVGKAAAAGCGCWCRSSPRVQLQSTVHAKATCRQGRLVGGGGGRSRGRMRRCAGGSGRRLWVRRGFRPKRAAAGAAARVERTVPLGALGGAATQAPPPSAPSGTAGGGRDKATRPVAPPARRASQRGPPRVLGRVCGTTLPAEDEGGQEGRGT